MTILLAALTYHPTIQGVSYSRNINQHRKEQFMKTLEITGIQQKKNKAGSLIEVIVTANDLDSLILNPESEVKEIKVKFDLEDEDERAKFLKIFWSKSMKKGCKNIIEVMDKAVKNAATIWLY